MCSNWAKYGAYLAQLELLQNFFNFERKKKPHTISQSRAGRWPTEDKACIEHESSMILVRSHCNKSAIVLSCLKMIIHKRPTNDQEMSDPGNCWSANQLPHRKMLSRICHHCWQHLVEGQALAFLPVSAFSIGENAIGLSTNRIIPFADDMSDFVALSPSWIRIMSAHRALYAWAASWDSESGIECME